MKVILALISGALALPGARAPGAQVALESHFAPHVDRTDRGVFARYELHVANRGTSAVRLHALAVRDARSGTIVLGIAGDQLRTALAVGQLGCDTTEGVIAPGGECAVYVDTNAMGRTPRALRNSVSFVADGVGGQANIDLPVPHDATPVLGPPLGRGTWVAVHHPGWARGHRRVFYPAARGNVLPGRFAIDFVKISPEGAVSCGDPDRPSDAFGYGDSVLAVADGRIAAVRDGVAESKTIRGNPAHDPETAPGNYVVLALAQGKFATYEHLRPGSIRVREGDRVRRGAVLGELGFTGDSTGPHLHFHVSDSVAPLGGEGMPFLFDSFTLLGDYPDIARLGQGHWHDLPAKTVRRVRPGVNSVLSFVALASADSASRTFACAVRAS
jgi:hypothetical protein